MEKTLPPIPAKRYFTIGEVSDLCCVKPHVLRYWEQEFTQLRPMKRRGNRRYYQHHEVLMIRRIRDLLYDQGFTISGARNKMQDFLLSDYGKKCFLNGATDGEDVVEPLGFELSGIKDVHSIESIDLNSAYILFLRRELLQIRFMLSEGECFVRDDRL